MRYNTYCASPYPYRNIISPNTVDLANSNIDPSDSNSCTYRRDLYGNHNSSALISTLNCLYGSSDLQVRLFNSGQAAMSAMCLARFHNRILYDKDLYPETKRVIGLFAKQYKEFSSFDEIKPGDLFVLESISIPQLKKRDLKKISESIHLRGGEILVDNSVLTSYWCNPFEFGADYVLDSLAKQCNGHNNGMLGSLIIKAELSSKAQKLGTVKQLMGNAPHALDCYSIQIGLQTLHVRLEYIAKSVYKLAKYLASVDAKFTYSTEAGLIFVFFDSSDPIDYIHHNLPLFIYGDTFGSAYSVFDHFKGLNTLRLSIGLEDPEDLIDALRCVESVWQ